MRLEGKTAIVTGAGSGLGRAMTLLFAAEGASVACVDIDQVGLEKTLEEAPVDGDRIIAVEADVACWEAMRSAVDTTLEAFGTVDVAVANAGIVLPGTAESTEMADWDRVLAVNLTGVWLTARAVLPVMRARHAGSIVTVASASATVGMRAVAAYSAAKAGVVGLTRQIAADYARDNIRVNAIAPGITETPMMGSVFGGVQELSQGERTLDERVQAAARQYPLRRLGRPEDIANAACFLASDDASWVTAAVIPVDGGYTGV